MVQDDEGRWWSKHPENGEWHYHNGSGWVRGTPPGYQPVGPDLRQEDSQAKQPIPGPVRTAISPAIDWKRIGIAVLLSGSIQILSGWLFVLLTPYVNNIIDDMQHGLLRGAVFTVSTIATTFLQVGSVFSPLVFGFWASLGWPGRHLLGYVFLGLSAGLLNIIGVLGLGLAGDQWEEVFVISFVGPALVFISGALFGDWVKRKKLSRDSR